MTQQIIKRGILQSFSPATYSATVLIIEATSYVLSGVPIATSIDINSAVIGDNCAILFFDANNPSDAIILAVYGSGPALSVGRIIFVASFQQINASVINSGVTETFTLVSPAAGIPTGALGTLFKAYFSATATPAHIDLAAHSGNLSETCSIGEVTSTSQTMNGGGILPLDSNGKIDIKANGANCTVNLFTYGYVI
jgi:hypothetical protein